MSAHLVSSTTDENGNKEMKILLPETEEQRLKMELIQKGFEEAFGKDQNNRTLIQWERLINKYTMPVVEKFEKLTRKQILKRIKELKKKEK